MSRPGGRTTAVLCCALAVPVLLTACSATNSSSATTAPNRSIDDDRLPDRSARGAGSACSLLSTTQIRAITGTDVAAPTASNKGSTTTCTYKASDPSQSVIIEFQGGASTTTFAASQQAFELRYGSTTPISGLGTQAYVGTVTSGQVETYTVVTLVGSAQVVVVGSGSLSHVEELAEHTLAALYAKSVRGHSASTGTTSSSSTDSGE